MATHPGKVDVDSRTGYFVIAATVLGSAVAMLTATVVSVALPSIASELGASTAAQQWVVNAYLLTVASLILIAPVTATALARVTEDRSGAASGANNAISRTGQVAAVLVGLVGVVAALGLHRSDLAKENG